MSDKNPFARKSIFLWDPSAVGTPEKIAALLIAAGFEGVYLHGENLSRWRQLHTRSAIATYQAAGLAVVGSVAVYGNDPAAEGAISATMAKEYALDGWVYDIEGIYERQPGAPENTSRMLGAFRSLAPALPLAWCSWAYYLSSSGVQWHPVNVLKAALPYVDYGMPMTYWTNGETAAHAVSYLDGSLKQWRSMTDKPIIPAGRSYNGDRRVAQPEAVIAFAQRVVSLGCPGISWWSMQHAYALPAIWQALTATPKMVKIDQPPVVVETQLDRIERGIDELLRRG